MAKSQAVSTIQSIVEIQTIAMLTTMQPLVPFLRIPIGDTVKLPPTTTAHNQRHASHQPRPDKLVLVLLPIQTMAQPDTPSNVKVSTDSRHEVPRKDSQYLSVSKTWPTYHHP